jgi:hypothetical protein
MDTKSKTRSLKVEVVFHGREGGESLPPTRAYLFDRAGKLVKSERVEKGELSFDVAPDQNYRVVVGPDLIGTGQEPPNLEQQLSEANAASHDVIAQLNQTSVRVALSKYIWYCWWQTCIVVHGTVKKLINPGSPNPQYLPLCTGVVQIFQVDLGCTLDQMASFQVLNLRDLIVDRLRGLALAPEKVHLIKGPIPPGPLAEGKAIGKATAHLRQLKAETQMISAKAAEGATAEKQIRIAPSKPALAQMSLSHAELATQLSNLDGLVLKQSIVASKAVLWWILCELIPDWAFCWQELGEVPIQSDGSFAAEICFWCPADFPDLYFEVVQNINGMDTEVYDPQIACTTYYDYDGSQSVDIVVDDPRAVACPVTDGGPDYLYIEVLGITDIDLQNINGLTTPFTFGTGLVTWGGNPNPVPFGGRLAFNMKYHPNMYGYYYRWSYKFDGDPDFTQISTPVTHQYQVLVSISPLTFQKVPDPLGPFTLNGVHNLYKFHDPSKDYVSVDNYWDLFYGFFDSTGGIADPPNYDYYANDGVSNRLSGMCTLMLEVFDSAGNFVPCNNPLGLRTEGDQGTDLLATRPFTYLEPQGNMFVTAPTGNITDHGRFIFRIRVDNNQTIAKLRAVHDGSTYADLCGFLHFASLSDTISIDYVARHHFDHLNWELDVYRGLCGLAASTSANGSSPGAPPPAFATFNKSASALLGNLGNCGSCANGAAFAVNLYCWAWATDGRFRQSQYDSKDTIAFALLTP